MSGGTRPKWEWYCHYCDRYLMSAWVIHVIGGIAFECSGGCSKAGQLELFEGTAP